VPVLHVTSEGSQNRLNYNKKAMDEIRQSLQNYHVSPGGYDGNMLPTAVTTQLANGSGVGNTGSSSVATSASDNMVRQVMLLGANEASSAHWSDYKPLFDSSTDF